MTLRNVKYSAGILPYAVDNGKIFYLLGKDWRDYGWSDFGGKCEMTDASTEHTACREFYEETMGSVYSLDTPVSYTHLTLPTILRV